MTPVKIAIVGAGGWMGRVHAAGYMNIPYFFGEQGLGAEVVLAVESTPRLQAQVERYLPNARFTTNWRDAMTDAGVDLVDICLPDNMHYEGNMCSVKNR
jgi:predicted dehydrogenase